MLASFAVRMSWSKALRSASNASAAAVSTAAPNFVDAEGRSVSAKAGSRSFGRSFNFGNLSLPSVRIVVSGLKRTRVGGRYVVPDGGDLRIGRRARAGSGLTLFANPCVVTYGDG